MDIEYIKKIDSLLDRIKKLEEQEYYINNHIALTVKSRW
jgi:hypothetical protein